MTKAQELAVYLHTLFCNSCPVGECNWKWESERLHRWILNTHKAYLIRAKLILGKLGLNE